MLTRAWGSLAWYFLVGEGVLFFFAGKGRHSMGIGGGVMLVVLVGKYDVLLDLLLMPLALSCMSGRYCKI